eukprot:snap_masked-scaffold_9-processed-gene-12.33-mRNA-1 protein AED:1.00 eAED:1.00 QI:0/0/0/0/1/1/2/0/159
MRIGTTNKVQDGVKEVSKKELMQLNTSQRSTNSTNTIESLGLKLENIKVSSAAYFTKHPCEKSKRRDLATPKVDDSREKIPKRSYVQTIKRGKRKCPIGDLKSPNGFAPLKRRPSFPRVRIEINRIKSLKKFKRKIWSRRKVSNEINIRLLLRGETCRT